MKRSVGNSYRCPDCGGKTRVTDSRPNNVDGIRRRRHCLECGYKFTTMEFFVGETGQINFIPVFLQYEKLSTEGRQIMRLIMDVLTRVEK